MSHVHTTTYVLTTTYQVNLGQPDLLVFLLFVVPEETSLEISGIGFNRRDTFPATN